MNISTVKILSLALAVAAPAFGADRPVPPHRTEGNDPGAIVPINLGIVPGCADSSPYSMNNGAYPHALVIGGAANCGNARYPPHTWRNGTWSPVDYPVGAGIMGGWVSSISDDSASDPSLIVEFMFNGYNAAWLKTTGQPVAALPLPQGRYAESAAIDSNGQYIVGGRVSGNMMAVRLARNEAGWSQPLELTPGRAVAVSEDGRVVAGNGITTAWVWTADPAGGGTVHSLGADTEAYDLTHDGDMVVGERRTACKNKPAGCMYPIPVYWTAEGGRWVMHDLQAIDNVDSRAFAVAKVDGAPIIVGHGFTNQDGGILRPVAWIPDSNGSYGAPLRLEPLGGAFESWAEAVDVNRNGIVLGWSDQSATDWTTTAVIWPLFESPAFGINAGIGGAWYDPALAGQGFFIDVAPASRFLFLSWFTYTDGAAADAGQQHWFTAQGNYQDDTAELVIYESLGGRFDDPQAVDTQPVGEATLQFLDCGTGELTYDIETRDLRGSLSLQRVVPGSGKACEHLAGSDVQTVDINAGMDGAWYEPDTAGQGLFIDAHSDPQSENYIFVGWFTFGETTASGQRWLTAQGGFDGPGAVIDVHESTGGSFGLPGGVTTLKVGTMSLDFQDCGHATLNYSLTGEAAEGAVELSRVIPGTEALCMELANAD